MVEMLEFLGSAKQVSMTRDARKDAAPFRRQRCYEKEFIGAPWGIWG